MCHRISLLITLGGILLLALPAAAQTGSCSVGFTTGAGQFLVECTDGVIEKDCPWDWSTTACIDLDYEWIGSCFFADNQIGTCWLWDLEEGPETPTQACEERFDGEWFPDSLTCGEPVPTLPPYGLLILLVLLLVSSCFLLARHGGP